VLRGRRALPHELIAFVDLEPRLLHCFHGPIGERLRRIIGVPGYQLGVAS
jgi:hypothetical protein